MGILVIITMIISESFQIIICHRSNFILECFSFFFCLFVSCYLSCTLSMFLFVLHIFNVFVCFTHFQCFCLFVFCYLFYTFSMFLFVYILLFVLHLFNVFFLGGLFVFYCEFFFNESDFSSSFA
jgi:hypothetical protein